MVEYQSFDPFSCFPLFHMTENRILCSFFDCWSHKTCKSKTSAWVLGSSDLRCFILKPVQSGIGIKQMNRQSSKLIITDDFCIEQCTMVLHVGLCGNHGADQTSSLSCDFQKKKVYYSYVYVVLLKEITHICILNCNYEDLGTHHGYKS